MIDMVQESLDKAKAYTNKLSSEVEAHKGRQEAALAADQGEALRDVIYHCTAAICAALEKL